MTLQLQTRPFDRTKDMALIAEWWKCHGDEGVPVGALPKVGVFASGIVDGRRQDLVAGWLYQTDSAICWIEWVVANPEIPSARRPGAVEYVIDRLMTEGRDRGFAIAFLSTRHERLMEKAKRCGFQVDESASMTMLTCNLQTGG